MILIISTCKNSLHELEFVRPIESILMENNISFLTKHYTNINKSDLTKAEKIIISGTSLADNDFLKKENLAKFNWIKTTNKPVLGICAGAEIVGLIFNSQLKEKKQIGLINVQFNNDFLSLKKGKHEVYNLHGLYPELNKQFNVYAQADSCPQSFKHKIKPIYGVLFHPEVRQKELIVSFSNLKK
ncbi:MAG: hypothetical protein WC796_03995 [Candidatus Pacearchaeota archaeon]|jgi:GMP synthase (glutamine-hydrolysing)